jgi:hypothetical protein
VAGRAGDLCDEKHRRMPRHGDPSSPTAFKDERRPDVLAQRPQVGGHSAATVIDEPPDRLQAAVLNLDEPRRIGLALLEHPGRGAGMLRVHPSRGRRRTRLTRWGGAS